ncbi:exo-beta-N-acetylmuramidase NamZ family protein [Thermosulfuriphilus sp.]
MVATGLSRLLAEPPGWLKGRRLALLCHQASVDEGLRPAPNLIAAAFPGQLKCLFAPQHGFFAQKQDNMVPSADGLYESLNVPIFSLYGRRLAPEPEMLDLFDVLLVDLQDVGCRVYTFASTMFLAMEACARAGKTVVILDRPNPIGGLGPEGPFLLEPWRSFVGMVPVALCHGLTLGELALVYLQTAKVDLDLQVITMAGWRRSVFFDETGLPWVMPSPNMPTLETALVYPGQVILEGTNLSEGRGTTRPFEIFGAPFVRPAEILSWISDRYELPGVFLRELIFEPTFHKWQGETCRGFQIHVIDRTRFEPVWTTLVLIQATASLYPQDFALKAPPYEYDYRRLPMDLIIGDSGLREALLGGDDLRSWRQSWRRDSKVFFSEWGHLLLYEE